MRVWELAALGRRVQETLGDPTLTEEERLAKWQAILDEPDTYDARRDFFSESRYEDDPRVEDDSAWRETLPESGCDG